MIGILRSTYSRKTDNCLKREIVEILDMTEDEYYAPLIEIETKYLLQKLAEQKEVN